MLARCSRCLRDLELRRSLRRMQRDELSVRVQIDSAYDIQEACDDERDGFLLAGVLAHRGAVPALLMAIENHAEDDTVMRAVMRALRALTRSGEVADQMREAGVERAVRHVLSRHPSDPYLREDAAPVMDVLRGLHRPLQAMEYAFRRGQMGTVLFALSRHVREAHAAAKGLSCIWQRAKRGGAFAEDLLDQGVAPLVVQAIQASSQVPEVQSRGCGAISELAKPLRGAKVFGRCGGVRAALDAMRLHPDSFHVTQLALWALHQLAAYRACLLRTLWGLTRRPAAMVYAPNLEAIERGGGMYLVEEARTRYRTAEGAMREEEQRRRKRRIRMARELAAERAAGKQKGGGGGSGPATAPTAGQKSSGTQLQGPRSTVVLGSGDGQLRQNEEKEEDEDDEEEDEEEEDEEDEEGEDEEEEDEEDEDGDTVLHQHQQQQQQQQQEQHVGAGVAGVTRGVSGEAEEKAEWDSAGGDGDGGRPSQQGADRVDAVPSGAEITAATPDGAVGAVFAGDDVSARSADSEATDLAAYDEDEDAAALQPLLLDDETEAFDPERARRVDDQYNAMELGEVEVRWQSRGKAGAVKKGVYGSSDRMRRVLMNWATQADVSTGQVDLLFIPHRLRTLRRWDQVKSAMEQVTRAKQLADAL